MTVTTSLECILYTQSVDYILSPNIRIYILFIIYKFQMYECCRRRKIMLSFALHATRPHSPRWHGPRPYGHNNCLFTCYCVQSDVGLSLELVRWLRENTEFVCSASMCFCVAAESDSVTELIKILHGVSSWFLCRPSKEWHRLGAVYRLLHTACLPSVN
jgi:hypothetical protein